MKLHGFINNFNDTYRRLKSTHSQLAIWYTLGDSNVIEVLQVHPVISILGEVPFPCVL